MAYEMVYVKYPIKIGFSDGSGKDENYLTDADDNVIVYGWGDCCRSGGIQDKRMACVIRDMLNKHRPRFKLRHYDLNYS